MVRCFSALVTIPIALIRRHVTVCVTRGLDPRVHPLREGLFSKMMDCRVKPGNDPCGSSWTQYAFVTLAVVLCGLMSPAWATGPLGPEIRFFSRSGLLPRPSRHPASHPHRQSTLRRLPDHAGRELLGGAGAAVARTLLRCSGDPLRRGDELERPAQARRRRSACPGPEYGWYRRRPE